MTIIIYPNKSALFMVRFYGLTLWSAPRTFVVRPTDHKLTLKNPKNTDIFNTFSIFREIAPIII